MNNSNEINYRTALQKPDCADNWLTEIEIEFEKVSEELEMDITLIFPITERPSRPRRFDLHVMNPESPITTTRPWRRLPPSPGPPPNRPLPPLPASASSTSLPSSLPIASGQKASSRLRDRFRLGRRSAIMQV
ncbi:hypothetical protein P167DRAFT_531918 [Morchella conica CCBAS932]|uniref:Uncharacterized protein n=1 Tax=Morchella conica CCBAS932 TaxID=1392247 RepID=A0A3N4L665_9PEZI|nr:hypothetical protein P167DRAFT_531918 [Morchella conica CCBAS932]